jgi:uncharacterized protein YukE
MPIIHVNTDALAQITVTFKKYSDDVVSQLSSIEASKRDLPDHWEGNSGQNAYNMLEEFLNHVAQATRIAYDLGVDLIQPRRAFEEADLMNLDTNWQP